MTLRQLQRAVRALGLTVTADRYGELRVNFPGGREATAYYTDDRDDALATAAAMAARHARDVELCGGES